LTSDLHSVRFLPSGAAVRVPAGTSLLDAAAAAGVRIPAPCGGEGTCGECRVRIEAGRVDRGGACLPAGDAAAGWVLACSSRVAGDVSLRVPASEEAEGRIVAEGGAGRAAGPIDPIARRLRIEVEAPSLENSFSDLERVERAIAAAGGPREVTAGLGVLRALAGALRSGPGAMAATVQDPGDGRPPELIRILPGDAPAALGLAVDVGTTTVAVQLVDLSTGHVVAAASDWNRQIDRGLDVISRINYARVAARREELRLLALDTLNALIGRCASERGIGTGEIEAAALAGNPTMVHLLLGLDPEYIRLEPYTPTVNRLPPLRAGEAGLAMHPEALVVVAPGIGSYVGGDIVAGLLETALAGPAGEPRLFLDIGTNGEIVLGNGEWLMACACSAGPAFEGAGIGCGMRAARGAIERIRIDPSTGRVEFSTVGGGRPRGICGSGIVDLLAEMRRAGIIDPSGKLDPGRPGVGPAAPGSRDLAWEVVGAADAEGGRRIAVSESDLGNLLRTKAAVYAGCALMLKAAGLRDGDISGVDVAGGFGRYLDIPKAIEIGMLPDIPLERYAYLGNTSLAGARAMLLSGEARRKVLDLAGRITYLELNTDPSYMDEYTGALFLPHTDAARFPSVGRR